MYVTLLKTPSVTSMEPTIAPVKSILKSLIWKVPEILFATTSCEEIVIFPTTAEGLNGFILLKTPLGLVSNGVYKIDASMPDIGKVNELALSSKSNPIDLLSPMPIMRKRLGAVDDKPFSKVAMILEAVKSDPSNFAEKVPLFGPVSPVVYGILKTPEVSDLGWNSSPGLSTLVECPMNWKVPLTI